MGSESSDLLLPEFALCFNNLCFEVEQVSLLLLDLVHLVLQGLHGVNGLLAVLVPVPLQLGYDVALLLGLLPVVLGGGRGEGGEGRGEGGEREGRGGRGERRSREVSR